MLHRLITPALFLGLVLIGNPAHAQGSSARMGMLTCRTSASLGLIVGSTQRLACQFRENSGWTQDYIGRMNRIGLDIGITAGGVWHGLFLEVQAQYSPVRSRAALSVPAVTSPWVSVPVQTFS